MKKVSQFPQSKAIFRQIAETTEESAALAQFLDLYRHSASFRRWLEEDYSQNSKLRDCVKKLTAAKPVPMVMRFAELSDESDAWDHERRQLKTQMPDRIYGGLTCAEIEELILCHMSGSMDRGAFLLAYEWRRAGDSAITSLVLTRAAIGMLDDTLRTANLRMLRHLGKAVRFLQSYSERKNRRSSVGFSDWWKLHVLFFILKHPRESYRTRDLRACLVKQGLDVGAKEIRRMCSRYGIRRDMRPGRPKSRTRKLTPDEPRKANRNTRCVEVSL